VLYEIFGETMRVPISLQNAFSDRELQVVIQMLQRKVNSPVTSSAGRLFDAVASVTGLRHRVSFEGQAAMELEFAIDENAATDPYPFDLTPEQPGNEMGSMVVDWEPLVKALLADAGNGLPAGAISKRFHDSLSEMIVSVARLLGEDRIVLTGGCFQNRYLTERTVGRLQAEGFRPYWHQRIPPNDGGIALGQAVAVSCRLSAGNGATHDE
jgi:hydrogenase maturation protein HypF